MLADLVVGIDVHLRANTVCILDPEGREVVAPRPYANTAPGTQKLIADLVQLLQARGAQHLAVGLEATSWYWWHLLRTLHAEPLLQPYAPQLYALNPRVIATFRQTFRSPDKTDRIDPHLIADRLRLERDLPPPFSYDETFTQLRLLTRQRFQLVREVVRTKARLLAHLYLQTSAYTLIQPFGQAFTATSRRIIADYSSEELLALPVERLAETLDDLGHHAFADPLATADKLQQVARASYPLPAGLQPTVRLLITQGLDLVHALEAQIKTLDQQIRATVAPIPHTLESVPGIGPVFAAGILSELGDLAAFDYDHAKVAHYAGLQWRRTESGRFRAEETPLTTRGNRYLRYYLCEAANSVRMHDAVYRAYYQRKYQEVTKHRHKRAVVLTARKLVRLVVALLTTNHAYQPGRT